jgi:Domain of unknown function (DU1801)
MIYEVRTTQEYLDALPEDRRVIVGRLITVIRENLPEGFEERISYGMIGFVVPIATYPAGYHVTKGEPLPFLSVASQKNYIAIYHMGLYSNPELEQWFREKYANLVPTKLDMGKSCIRFRGTTQIPYELIGELCRKTSVAEYVSIYEAFLRRE